MATNEKTLENFGNYSKMKSLIEKIDAKKLAEILEGMSANDRIYIAGTEDFGAPLLTIANQLMSKTVTSYSKLLKDLPGKKKGKKKKSPVLDEISDKISQSSQEIEKLGAIVFYLGNACNGKPPSNVCHKPLKKG